MMHKSRDDALQRHIAEDPSSPSRMTVHRRRAPSPFPSPCPRFRSPSQPQTATTAPCTRSAESTAPRSRAVCYAHAVLGARRASSLPPLPPLPSRPHFSWPPISCDLLQVDNRRYTLRSSLFILHPLLRLLRIAAFNYHHEFVTAEEHF